MTRDVFYAVALFLQLRAHYPELVRPHRGAGSLLIISRLDAQATFAKLFADIGRECDVRYAKLDDLMKGGLPPPSAVNSRHVQALRADLRAETLSHAAGLTSHSAILMYGKSGFLGRNEAGHGRSTVGLTRPRGPTLLMGPPDPYGLIGLVQTVLACHYVVYCADWHLPDALPPLSAAPQDLAAAVRPFETATWAELPLAVQIESPRGAVVLLKLTIRRRKLSHYAADLTAEPPSFPRVVGLDANHYYWGYCNPRTGRAMAWYGVNRKGAYLRLCQTSPKIRLRLPRNGVSEVWHWQDGYRLVLLPRLAFFAL